MNKPIDVTRRDFMTLTGSGMAAVALSGGLTACQTAALSRAVTADSRMRSEQMMDLSSIPNFCAHEHWGSIFAIGMEFDGFRADTMAGAQPRGRTTLLHLLLDPYLNGWLHGAGTDPFQIVKEKLGYDDLFEAARDRPVETFDVLRPALRDHQLTGTYQCTRRGILQAYEFDINETDPKALRAADNDVAANYAHMFTWYRELMKRVGFTEVIRPVHPAFYGREEGTQSAAEELAFTHTIMRVDPLLEYWNRDAKGRAETVAIVGIDPGDAVSWRHFLDKLFDISAEKKNTGIKQLQAYRRSLDFKPVEDGDVVFDGNLDPGQQRAFEDWVMHECCKRANDRGWPHQIHVGTHNLPDSNPLPLADLARRYPAQRIVMLHCWPFLDETANLAKHHHNVYIDACWQPVLNPAFLRDSLARWISYVPISKLMFSNDSTSIEMAVGSVAYTRELLGDALAQAGAHAGLSDETLRGYATDMLHNNAVRLYRIGREQT